MFALIFFVARLQAQPQIFLDRIVPQDETWIHHFDPETKWQCGLETRQFSHPKKFKVTPSAGKVMATIFGTVTVW